MYHLFFKTAYKIWYEIKLLKSLRKWFSILVREWRSCFFRVTQHTMGSLICHWNCIILVWNGHFDVGIDLVVVVRTMKLSKRHKNIWLWNLHYAKCLFEMGRLSCSYLRLLYKCILRFELLLPDWFPRQSDHFIPIWCNSNDRSKVLKDVGLPEKKNFILDRDWKSQSF